MSSLPHEAFLPFGKVELNDAGDVVRIHLKLTDENDYNGGNWHKVADAIVQSPSLKEITVRGYNRDEYSRKNALAAVFGRERTHPCALEKFCVKESNLGRKIVTVMLPFFESTPEIKELCFPDNGLGDEETILLSEVLNHIRVEYLDLYINQISGEGLGRLFSAEHSKHLHKLDLECNDIGALGFEAICRFLQRDDTELRRLYFDDDDVDQNQFRTVLESISPRSKLVALFNEEDTEDDPDEESAVAMAQILKNVVCNTDTFEALCESNHQLIWVGSPTLDMLNLDPILTKAIIINNQLAHGASIISRLRSKLRAFYFQGQFDVQPFIDMDVVLMPFALALVTRSERIFSMYNYDECDRWTERDFSMDNNDESEERDTFSELTGGKCVVVGEGNLGSVYRLVRNSHLPELFTFPSSKSRIQEYESRISSLEEEIARLAVENEELRSQFDRPLKKRASK